MPPQLRARAGDVSGQKWVDDNHDLKAELMQANDGVMPFTPAFTTSDFPGSDQWSEETPPAILFYLELPPSLYDQRQTPGPLLDESGKPLQRDNGKIIKDFPGLPRRISLDVNGWEIEAWRRLDPRITYQDIIDRMTVDLGQAQELTDKIAKIPSKNSLQNHCRRNCRKVLNSYTDYHRREEPHRVELTALQHLNASNIINNTVLKVYRHPLGDRLAKVKFVRKVAGGIIGVEPVDVTLANWLTTTYPINYFTQGFTKTFGMTEGMTKATDLLLLLQERAYNHGHDDFDWEKLGRSCLPTSWFDRTKEKSDAQPTFDGGCEVCTWKDPELHPNGIKRPVVKKRQRVRNPLVLPKQEEDSDEEDENYFFDNEAELFSPSSTVEDTIITDGARAIMNHTPLFNTAPVFHSEPGLPFPALSYAGLPEMQAFSCTATGRTPRGQFFDQTSPLEHKNDYDSVQSNYIFDMAPSACPELPGWVSGYMPADQLQQDQTDSSSDFLDMAGMAEIAAYNQSGSSGQSYINQFEGGNVAGCGEAPSECPGLDQYTSDESIRAIQSGYEGGASLHLNSPISASA